MARRIEQRTGHSVRKRLSFGIKNVEIRCEQQVPGVGGRRRLNLPSLERPRRQVQLRIKRTAENLFVRAVELGDMEEKGIGGGMDLAFETAAWSPFRIQPTINHPNPIRPIRTHGQRRRIPCRPIVQPRQLSRVDLRLPRPGRLRDPQVQHRRIQPQHTVRRHPEIPAELVDRRHDLVFFEAIVYLVVVVLTERRRSGPRAIQIAQINDVNQLRFKQLRVRPTSCYNER